LFIRSRSPGLCRWRRRAWVICWKNGAMFITEHSSFIVTVTQVPRRRWYRGILSLSSTPTTVTQVYIGAVICRS
jgi:hypothetical protein